MRIKSGSPKAGNVRGAGKAGKAKKAGGAQFSGLVEEKVDTEEEARKLRSRLLEELKDLADDLEDGKSSKEEASRKFVGLVIRERYGEQKGKGAKGMEEAIADMVEDDPNFVTRLQAQLKKLAKS
jgi:polyhydroxyalkanoate synthesis regulator phasin